MRLKCGCHGPSSWLKLRFLFQKSNRAPVRALISSASRNARFEYSSFHCAISGAKIIRASHCTNFIGILFRGGNLSCEYRAAPDPELGTLVLSLSQSFCRSSEQSEPGTNRRG